MVGVRTGICGALRSLVVIGSTLKKGGPVSDGDIGIAIQRRKKFMRDPESHSFWWNEETKG